MHHRIAVLFDNLGPYHIARLRVCNSVMGILAIENRLVSSDYSWRPSDEIPFQRVTLIKDEPSVGKRAVLRALRKALETFRPSLIVVPGWSSWLSLNAMRWAIARNVPIIVMSDSQQKDFRRVIWKEFVKKRFLRFYAAALVGGQAHREYLVQLGMPAPAIYLGYDVVDNDFFSSGSEHARSRSDEYRHKMYLPANYLLCSARFIPKKNLFRLLLAFSAVLEKLKVSDVSSSHWHLVILGDGELRPEIEKSIRELGLCQRVLLPGFKQVDELPAYYALASAFVLPSTIEQWGLVVNEAMASGLPVLVSERCGCVPDLVQNGRNGFTFDPFDINEIADRMLEIVTMNVQDRQAMGDTGKKIIAQWSPEAFAKGLQSAADFALANHQSNSSFFDKLLLRILSYR